MLRAFLDGSNGKLDRGLLGYDNEGYRSSTGAERLPQFERGAVRKRIFTQDEVKSFLDGQTGARRVSPQDFETFRPETIGNLAATRQVGFHHQYSELVGSRYGMR